jgi:hypothetical protein
MKRFSIGKLMLGIGILMFGAAALCRSSYLTAAALLTATVVTLAVASLGIFDPRPEKRAYGIGFALCGWTYFVLHMGPWFDGEIGRHSLDAAVADFVYATVGPQSALISGRHRVDHYLARAWLWKVWSGWENGLGHETPFCPTTYVRSVHCLMSLLFGWVGGVITRSRVKNAGTTP